MVRGGRGSECGDQAGDRGEAAVTASEVGDDSLKSDNLKSYKHAIFFALIPVVATFAIGQIMKALFSNSSSEGMEFETSMLGFGVHSVNLIWPYSVMAGGLAFIVWIALVQKKPSFIRGGIAGVSTVFLCYPVLGFLLGLMHPIDGSRLLSAFGAATSLTIFGNMLTFWITYPFGFLCGGILARKCFDASTAQNVETKTFD